MAILNKKIDDFNSDERKELLKEFFNQVILPQRKRLIFYNKITNQSAQVDADGHIAQLIASIVTGIPGINRHGKSGKHAGDLFDGTEVKSTYKAEQKKGMEDAHINFGGMNTKKMEDFLSHNRCIIVHTYYDVLGRFKSEILDLDLKSDIFTSQFKRLQETSKAKNPQFQPRLYPDGVRNRLNETESSFKKFGAKVLARVVETKEGAVVDLWNPEKGIPIEQLLTINNEDSIAKINIPTFNTLQSMNRLEKEELAKDFFKKCFVDFRKSYLPFCKITSTTQNLSFANLSQHLVSIITGIKGTNSNARGFDLENGSDIKQALGIRGDDLGTEDVPRLNLGNNKDKMLAWPSLYAIRIDCFNQKLRLKILKANINEFRNQVRDYFCSDSIYKDSPNMQYHISTDFDKDVFTGENSKGEQRILHFERLFALTHDKDGNVKVINVS